MFLVSSNPQPSAENTLMVFKKQFGIVLPHFELLATLNPKRFEMFIQEIIYLANHETVNPDLFPFIRLFIASKEGFVYCQSFNTKLLLAKRYGKDVIQNVKKEIGTVPLDDRHKLLAIKAVKAIYEAESFTVDDLDELLETGWSHADIYDAVDHAAFLFKNARIIKAYSI